MSGEEDAKLEDAKLEDAKLEDAKLEEAVSIAKRNMLKFVQYLRERGLINYGSCCQLVMFSDAIQMYCKTCPSPRLEIIDFVGQIDIDDYQNWLITDKVNDSFINLFAGSNSTYKILKKIVLDCQLANDDDSADAYIKTALTVGVTPF